MLQILPLTVGSTSNVIAKIKDFLNSMNARNTSVRLVKTHKARFLLFLDQTSSFHIEHQQLLRLLDFQLEAL